MRRIALVLMLVLVLVPLTVKAQGRVFYSGADRERVSSALSALGMSVKEVEFEAIGNVALPKGDTIWFVGASGSARCEQGVDVPRSDIDLWIETTELSLLALNIEDAREQLRFLTAGILCASTRFSEADLSRIAFLRGVTEAYAMNTTEAKKFFAQAISRLGRAKWDTAFPDQVKVIYDQAEDELKAQGYVDVTYDLDGLAVTFFAIDGKEMTLPHGSLRTLPGEHVVQWEIAGELSTRVVDVSKLAVLLSVRALQERLRERPAKDEDPVTWFVQEAFLGDLQGQSTVVVWDESENAPAFAYVYEKARTVARDVDPVRYLVGAPKKLVVTQVEAKFSPVGVHVGVGIEYGSHTVLPVQVGVTFRLVRGLALDFAFEAGFVGFVGLTTDENRLYLRPTVRAGVRYEFRFERLVRPYVGVNARVNFSADPTTRVGPSVVVGSVFALPSQKGGGVMALFLEGGGGPRFGEDTRPDGDVFLLAGIDFRAWKEKR